MFKKPINLNHNVTVEIEQPDITAAVQPVLDQVKQMLKQAGIALAIGIPAVILFALAASVAAEAIVENMND